MLQNALDSRPHILAKNVDVKELSRGVSYVVHSLPLATVPVRYFLIQQLTDVIKMATSVSPVVSFLNLDTSTAKCNTLSMWFMCDKYH